MNFEHPPEFPKTAQNSGNLNGTHNNNHHYARFRPDCSPLLRTDSDSRSENKNGIVRPQSNQMNNQYSNNSNVHNRLGNRHRFRNNNNPPPMNNHSNEGTHSNNGHFNRKRLSDEVNGGPSKPKRKWINKRQNSHYNTHVQDRLNRFKNNHAEDQLVTVKNEPVEEIDAPDITVQVVNNNVPNMVQNDEHNLPTRFKMVLNPKAQTAIQVIQQKIKQRQVVFPFPVTPNTTEISLHERFTML